MSGEEIIKFIVIVLVVCIIIYYIVYYPKREGLTSQSASSQSASSDSGIAGLANQFASNIKANTTQFLDNLLISKYRSDYENVIMNAHDYLSVSALQTLLNTNFSGNSQDIAKSFQQINAMMESQNNLNTIMKYIDSQ